MSSKESWSELENAVGALPSRRSYHGSSNSSVPSSWDRSTAAWDVGKRESVVSIKPDMDRLADGDTGEVAGFLKSKPADHPAVVIAWHEPENDDWASKARWRKAQSVFASYAHGLDLGWQVGLCLMHPTFFGFEGRDPNDWWFSECDVFLLDVYNHPESGFDQSLPWGAHPLSDLAGPALNWCRDKGVPMGIAEFGTQAAPNDEAYSSAWLEESHQWARKNGLTHLLWFDMNYEPYGGDNWEIAHCRVTDTLRELNS